jgi:hypothetical protein
VDLLRATLQASFLGSAKSFSMDAPTLLKREGLVAVSQGAEKRANFVEGTTDPRGRSEVFEPAHGPVVLYSASVVRRHPSHRPC